jgi:hypothetical protein
MVYEGSLQAWGQRAASYHLLKLKVAIFDMGLVPGAMALSTENCGLRGGAWILPKEQFGPWCPVHIPSPRSDLGFSFEGFNDSLISETLATPV